MALAYGLLPFAVVAAVRTHGAARLGWTLATAGMAVGVATSFNRNMWVGAVLGAGLLVLLGGAQVRRKLTVALVLVAVGTAIVLAQGTGTSPETPIGPLVKRATTLLDPRQVSREDSLRRRDREASQAWRSVAEHLILGVGVGVPFGVSYLEALPGGRVVRSSQLFLHNQYLYFLVVAGIPGLAALLWFLLAAAAAGLRARADPLAAACVVGLAMLAFSGLVMIAFAAENMITALCVVTAACVVYGERSDRIAEGRRTGRSPLPGGT